ncbi:uncharacterized protein FA14DRAFT_155625 [Meira miltonrushii]|uniref:SH3 domain-containing protein n=1 Tax=Meira miltonrushii TaxID=1280837 RepID=A0A316VFA8_9BASI|nr:uncharacterized protein FA14DRAFT_155625 [Meira miltonrushii]PWN36220.1 hypothetical protein FA14DRAFT_155625 [Meira miltonrushii]
MNDQTANAAVLNEVNNEANEVAHSQNEEVRRTNQKQQQHGVTIVEPTNTDKDEHSQQHDAQQSESTTSLNTSLITPPAGFVDGEVTPPLPNGQKRLHPLFDEDKIVSEAVARQEGVEGSTKNGGDPNKKSTEKERPNALRLLDSLGNEAGYPSPSGGFVPPITDENWALQQPPVPRSADGINSRSIQQNEEMNKGKMSTSSSNHSNSLSGQFLTGSFSNPSTLGQIEQSSSNLSNNNGESINRPSLAGHKLSSSQSSASGGVYESGGIATHSQAISARSSPSTLAPIRRRSSGSADVLSMNAMTPQEEGSYLPPLKIRDFAYEEVDPRHVGARDVGLPSPEKKHTSGSGFGMSPFGGQVFGGHEWGSTEEEYDDDDDDDEEDDDQEGYGNGSTGDMSAPSSDLPLGLYHAAYDFIAESDHELNIKVGQKVRLIGHVDGGWAIVVRVQDGQDDVAADEEETEKGLVPQAYLQWLAQ